MTEDVAKILAFRFEDFSTYCFPEKDYRAFGQIVLLSRRKHDGALDRSAFERLADVPHTKLDEIPMLDSPRYRLPASPPVALFRSGLIDEAELEAELRDSPLWTKLGNHQDGNGRLGRPPLPLHAGHLGLLLASGCLDGVVGQGKDRHIVRGKVEKLTHTEQEYEGDVLIEREVESYRVSIKLLGRDGQIRTLM
jgi:hypothetical protein